MFNHLIFYGMFFVPYHFYLKVSNVAKIFNSIFEKMTSISLNGRDYCIPKKMCEKINVIVYTNALNLNDITLERFHFFVKIIFYKKKSL